MSVQTEIDLLTLSGLRHRCSQESDRFFRRLSHDPRYCYELFRRAILSRDEHAWELIYQQYQPLVAGWVERHSLFQALDEETQYFVNRSFQKMWAVFTPQKFAGFPDLKSILRYLQMCVHSAIVDYARGREQAFMLEDELEELPAHAGTDEPDLEDQVLSKTQAEALWRWLDERFKNEKERRVVYGCFVLALKPGEVYTLYPGVFKDVKEVYVVKDNLLARLRRDSELKELLGDFE
jgi:hypothetical protein